MVGGEMEGRVGLLHAVVVVVVVVVVGVRVVVAIGYSRTRCQSIAGVCPVLRDATTSLPAPTARIVILCTSNLTRWYAQVTQDARHKTKTKEMAFVQLDLHMAARLT